MKKNIKWLMLIALLCFVLFLCETCYYQNVKRPYEYPNTQWVSQNPDIWFEVKYEYYEKYGSSNYGKITIDGTTTEIYITYDQVDGAEVCPLDSIYFNEEGRRVSDGEAWLFKGTCDFWKDKMVMHISDNSKDFLPRDITEITFIREDIAE